MNLYQILLMAPPKEGQEGGGGMSWIMIAMIFVVVYFFMLRPQIKKNKAQATFKEALNNGDKVITNGGVHGKIVSMKDNTCIIETEGGGRLKIEKSAISMDLSRALNTDKNDKNKDTK